MTRSALIPALLLSCWSLNSVSAQELVYTPVNPSFGGSPFNSGHLLAIAEVDRPDPPESDDPEALFGQESQADQFARQLESRILSQLSSDIVDTIFNGDAQTGTFAFDTTSVSFERFLDGTIELVIADNATGGTTTVTIPSFLTGN